MIIRKLLFVSIITLGSVVILPHTAAADGLSIGPLQYSTTLKAGESKKGFVQVQNLSGSVVEVRLKAQAFKQINDQGGLQFYDSEAITAGVKLDLNDIQIPARAAARVYFLLDGSRLPSGDVFAAILATTAHSDTVVTVPSAQVGTLLMVVNGTPPSHHADIGTLQLPFIQAGTALSMRFVVKNTDPPQKLTGFTPSITITTWPYETKTVTGPLVFAGRSREVAYTQPGNYIGLIVVTVKTGDSQQTRLVLAVTGFWRWLAPLILVVSFAAIIGIRFLRKWHHQKHRK